MTLVFRKTWPRAPEQEKGSRYKRRRVPVSTTPLVCHPSIRHETPRTQRVRRGLRKLRGETNVSSRSETQREGR